MSIHAPHPDAREHGLADDCPRCTEIAASPFLLMDDDLLRGLYTRTREWMRDLVFPRSANEVAAMRLMETVITQARRLDCIKTAEPVA